MTANVGVIGRARVGKDTAGAWLVENRGYVRVSFADPLKEAALRLDPIIEVRTDRDEYSDLYEYNVGLRWVVEEHGWEHAKTDFPEVRRILQELGMTIRALDPDFWLRAALTKVTEANDAGSPVVITDVRFPNEADSLRRAGFHLLYVDRPGVPHLDHASEGALTADDAGWVIENTSDIEDFLTDVEVFAHHVERRAVVDARLNT